MNAEVRTKDGPSLFDGIGLEVGAILEAYRTLSGKIRDLQGANLHKQEIPAKHAAEDIARVSGQINTLSSHLASVLTRHINRGVKNP